MKNAAKILPVLLAATLLSAERSGPYLGIGAGAASYDDEGRLAAQSGDESPVFRLVGGAFINRHLSVALAYDYFGAFDGVTESGEKAEEHFKVLSARVTGHYPLLNEKMDLFATFGAGEVFWDQTTPEKRSSSAASLVYGVGVGVWATSSLAVNVGYDLFQFGMDEGGNRYNMSLGTLFFDIQVQF